MVSRLSVAKRMMVLLPLAALLVLVLLACSLERADSTLRGWESSMLIGASWWGALLALSQEGLSLIRALRTGPSAAVWVAIILLGLLALAWRREALRSSTRPREPFRWTVADGALFPVGGLLALLLAIAWVSPPNNVDSLLYHMSRVMHWAQNESLRHYATAYGHQLWNPPWAEMAILNLRLLWGNDRLANLVQWAAVSGVMIAVSGLTRLMGLDRRGRTLAIAIGISIPMLVLQATSTQNDLVTSFWLLTSVFLVLLVDREAAGNRWPELTALGCAVGVGLLTKGTFYVYVTPVLVLFLLRRDWRSHARRAAGQVGLVALLAILVNLGYWTRNLGMGGSPLGPMEWVRSQSSGGLASVPLMARLLSAPAVVLRAASLHLATPWAGVNRVVEAAVNQLTGWSRLGLPPLALTWGWNHEDLAGAPLHLVLILTGLIGAAVVWRRLAPAARKILLVAVAGYLLLPPVALASSTTYGARLQLPFFVLSAAWLAAVVMALHLRRLPEGLTIVLLVLSLPWVLFNATRPAIALSPEPGRWELPCTDTLGCTRTGSVFSTPASDVLFAGVRHVQQGYTAAAEEVKRAGCTRVGLRIDSSDPEYPLWYLLQAPESGVRIETLYVAEGLEGLIDENYVPCAIICTICDGKETPPGMGLALQTAGVSVFLTDEVTPPSSG